MLAFKKNKTKTNRLLPAHQQRIQHQQQCSGARLMSVCEAQGDRLGKVLSGLLLDAQTMSEFILCKPRQNSASFI